MSKAGEIIEGWSNLIIKKEHVEKVAKARLLICDTCEYNSKFHKTKRPDEHCMDCGCTLSAKTRCLHCACPKSKWLATEKE